MFLRLRKNSLLFTLVVTALAFFFIGTNAYAMDIKVDKIEIKEKSDTIDVETPVINDGKIVSDITFNKVDDFVIYTLTLKNNDSKKYTIKSIMDTNENDYIDIEYDVDGVKEDIEIDANSSVKMDIKITYKKELINVESLSFKDVSIKVNMEKEDGSVSELVINPGTQDNIIHYVVVFLISSLAIVLIILKKKIGKIKIGNYLLVLALVILPFSALANELFELKFKFSNITIIGEMEEYEVVLKTENGEETVVKKYNEKLDDVEIPVKDGYTFEGWYDENGIKVELNEAVKGDMVLEARLTKDIYKIEYKLNDGVVTSNPSEYTIDDEFTLNNPSKEGYTFDGWKDENGVVSTNVNITKGTTGNKKFEAIFTPIEYTITYDLDGGVVSNNSNSYTVEDELVLNNPTKTGYTFVGWLENDSTTPVKNVTIVKGTTGNKTYKAIYNIIKYQISYELNGGEATSNPSEYTVEDEVVLIKPLKVGYTFIGWQDGSSTTLIEDITISKGTTGNKAYEAVFTPNTNTPYKVLHKLLDTEGEEYELFETDELVGTTDTTVSPEVKTYTGFTSPEAKNVLIKGDGSSELEYLYDREKRNLTLTNDRYIETVTPAGEYYYDKEITLKAKPRMDYVFKNWTDGSTNEEITFNLKEDVTIGPVYEPISSVVRYTVSDELEMTTFKKVSITYTLTNIALSDVVNQYSLDDGASWNTYNGEFIVRDNMTLKARTIIKNSNNYVIGTADRIINNIIDTESILDEGMEINSRMITLAGTSDDVKKVLFASKEQYLEVSDSFGEDNIVSIEGSATKAYMWFDDGVIYYYAPTNRIKMNENSSRMFSGFYNLEEISLEGFDTTNVTNMKEMFYGLEKLTTIYVENKFITTNVTNSNDMFTDDTLLVGGNGTVYSDEHIDLEYARVDKEGQAGYFTLK
ncbi:MAG: InlB B-repeat-containing protein [Bacilli bacterium]|nr:InlB B-repeat-containing protein [Bacilli bacterium]